MKTSKSFLKRAAQKLGLYPVGNFLIGRRSNDIISGLAIDRTPNFTYLWTFVVPTYDDLFMHMSLGERVALCDEDVDCLVNAKNLYTRSLRSIIYAKDLIDYIDRKEILGEYSYWARYISYIREGNSQAADDAFDLLLSSPISNHIREKASRVRAVQVREGLTAAQQILEEWSDKTSALLSDLPSEI